MSSATALTIIAISMAVMAFIAVFAVVVLIRLVSHLMAFEQILVNELSELRQLASQLRETTERIGATVHEVQTAARRIGGVVGAVAALFVGRNSSSRSKKSSRSLWLQGASLGWKLVRQRRQKKRQEKAPKKKTAAALQADGPSLPM